MILRAFCEAHKKILKSYDDIWEAGTTTMLAGLLLELSPDEPDKHNGENGQQADDESPDEVLCCADEPNGHGKHNGAVNGQEKEKEKGKKRGKSASRPEEGTEKEPEDNEEEDKGKEKEGPKEEVRWVFICASVGMCSAAFLLPSPINVGAYRSFRRGLQDAALLEEDRRGDGHHPRKPAGRAVGVRSGRTSGGDGR